MRNISYRASSEAGGLLEGTISAADRPEFELPLKMVRIEPRPANSSGSSPRLRLSSSVFQRRPRGEDVTVLTLDLALLLRAGMRIHHALDLLVREAELGPLRGVVLAVHQQLVSGATFADAVARYPNLFPAGYVALVRAGEASGSLEKVLDLVAAERSRAERLMRRTRDALRYPAFLLFAAGAVLVFFLSFVLPQFSSVLRDFGATTDGITEFFLSLSGFLSNNKTSLSIGALCLCVALLMGVRSAAMRAAVLTRLDRVPVLRRLLQFHRTALFCRNLHILQTANVPITTTLRILAQIMAASGGTNAWQDLVNTVRHGSKLSDALAEHSLLPTLAIRLLRLGEDSGQLGSVAQRVADYYETKLERALERIVGFVGPAAILGIATVVGGLIASVMSSLLSVTQLVG